MDLILQLISNVLIPGLLFALIAAGFSLTYSVTRVLHLANGGVVIVAGYGFYTGYSLWHWPIWSASLLAIAIAILTGLFINAQIHERMREHGIVSAAGMLVATISVLLIIQNILLAIFGSAPKSFADLQGTVHEFGPVIFTDHEIRILVLIPILLIIFILLLKKTKTGKALRAVADHEQVAEVVGIASRKMRMLAFGISSFLAGIAGILFAIEYNLDPSMGIMITVRMIFRAILGGVGSIGGAILGSLSTETIVALTGYYWNVSWVDFSSFLLTFVVLLIRPNGILGKKKRIV
ncbi:MAG: branched-chain amino acid ABC transporter permease [Candidatus Uhrbacteria bacterium]|nr:branched-chain amino acid ABC transporter permease [Candidatus Uhrbacteria bacterium]MDP3793233.1 branched-chain amino acid ABC transporter permease [Candidatus Uhrbacteria bacterium]